MRPTIGVPRGVRLGATLLLLTTGLILTGCDTHDLVLKVDILSFVQELQTPILVPNTPAFPAASPPASRMW